MAVTIPETITVHLGAPNSDAENVTLSFPDYIKNVASSEIYPSWPENALRANIYAQISFALNRVFTEWYRSQGYDFDITSSTQYDQAFVKGRDIFENISRIVDELFNDYIKRNEFNEPLFAQYCNGTTVTCDGLSQWGSVPLANQGFTPYEILTNYYGPDINLVFNAPISENIPSYSGPLQVGSSGERVRRIQIALNRISTNYPSIPKVSVDGIFGENTAAAVRRFQEIFDLSADGIVGPSTWYRIQYIYTSVKRLADLYSEGETLLGSPAQYTRPISQGDTGDVVRIIQYFLAQLSQFYTSIPFLTIDGTFGLQTKSALLAAQRQFGLPQTGIVDQQTWNKLEEEVRKVIEAVPPQDVVIGIQPYPGYELTQGMRGASVVILQTYLAGISQIYPQIQAPSITGVFGPQTRGAVVTFQELFGLTPDGIVGPNTWSSLTSVYSDIMSESATSLGQFPGNVLSEGNSDFA